MKKISLGIKGTAELLVRESDLAVNVGSGNLEVLSTPTMAMLMEKAACACVADYMDSGETTVGTELSIKHLSATPVGMKILAEAEVSALNGRELVFNVAAYDEAGLIGNGIHKRFLVFSENFMSKANTKSK